MYVLSITSRTLLTTLLEAAPARAKHTEGGQLLSNRHVDRRGQAYPSFFLPSRGDFRFTSTSSAPTPVLVLMISLKMVRFWDLPCVYCNPNGHSNSDCPYFNHAWWMDIYGELDGDTLNANDNKENVPPYEECRRI